MISIKKQEDRNIRPMLFLLISIVLLSIVGIKQVVYGQFTTEDFEETVNSYFDERIYVCMNLEELGGLDEDNDQVTEDNKKYCNELLEDTDYFKKKELIKKYGELG